jgi:hypothetical protein
MLPRLGGEGGIALMIWVHDRSTPFPGLAIIVKKYTIMLLNLN